MRVITTVCGKTRDALALVGDQRTNHLGSVEIVPVIGTDESGGVVFQEQVKWGPGTRTTLLVNDVEFFRGKLVEARRAVKDIASKNAVRSDLRNLEKAASKANHPSTQPRTSGLQDLLP